MRYAVTQCCQFVHVSYTAVDVPGPIDNNSIMVTKSGCHQVSLKVNSDYGQLSEETWQFLFNIYGGGPVVKQTRSPPATLASSDVKVTEGCDGC